MTRLPGVYPAKKKNGETYYRSSITYKNKHISLGSFPQETSAHQAYQLANAILTTPSYQINSYSPKEHVLSFHKWVILINFRDNGIYFKTPIYIRHRFFEYYLEQKTPLKFAVDDLFYYANHQIMKRGGHLFVADFGMQVNILSRYGIKNFAVPGRDFLFMNGDDTDYRYENIAIINKYHGVQQVTQKGVSIYVSKIHINGDYIIGRYSCEDEAAIAYNKAADLLVEKGLTKEFPRNFINKLNQEEYNEIYSKIKVSKRIKNFNPPL